MISGYGPRRNQRRFESGQSLVETALGMVFFFIFVLGVLDLGRLYFIYIALEDSAGEAAIFLSINPDCPVAAGDADAGTYPFAIAADCDDPNNARDRATKAAEGYFEWDEDLITIEYPTGSAGVGNTVRVTLQYEFTVYTPIITLIAGDTLTLTSEATQTILLE